MLDPGRPSIDRRIDVADGGPLASSSRWTWLRTALLAGSAALLLALGPDGADLASAVLATGAAIQLLALPFARRHDVSMFMAIGDIAIASIVIAVLPDLYPAGVLWIGAITTWQAITNPPRTSVPVGVFAIVAPAVTGIVADIDIWWAVAATQTGLASAHLVFGRALRAEVHETENDLLATVSTGGAFVHRSSLSGGTAAFVHGDIEGVTGYTAEEWIGLDHRSILHPDDIDSFWLDIEAAALDTMIDRTGRFRHADGSWVWLRDVSRVTRDRHGRPVLRGFTVDVTASQERHHEMRRQARLDPLTGLPNRLALDEQIEAHLGRDEPFALLLFDLDRFKEINDTLGHEAGDQILAVIGRRIRNLVGPADHVSRMGGDEFAILAAGMSDGGRLRELTSAISERCRTPIVHGGVNLSLSASIGIVIADPVGSGTSSDRATLLRHADIAMYAAKRASIPYRVFDESLERTSTLQLRLNSAFPNALETGQIELFFQPQFDLLSRHLIGAEGLVRWRHPELGLLAPDVFLDVALLSDRSAEFLQTTVEHGVRMAKRARAHGAPVRIAVNVSIAAVRDLSFSFALTELIRTYGIPPDLLTIEITETAADQLSPDAVRAMNEVRDTGVKISLDDFGTGYSSLDRLRTLRVDELKIDRAFVRSMPDDRRHQDIIRTIIELAQRLDLSVVAEGVEHEEQARLLAAMGCTIGQGFLFAPAMAPDEFVTLATDRATKVPRHGA
ncbi:MAG: putative bifunctional diguanylate cyclase/phosphodiesterase [Ilumatobacteraceae bacterium]